MQHQSFLEYKRYRYLKVAAWLVLIAAGAYGWHRNYVFDTPGGVGYGGTWMGYVLGSVAGLLILWLLWLGIRKRRYRASMTTLQGWVSAHVYLGLAAVVVATLHSGLELGLNLHTLTYVLMLVVVFSGIYGVLVFLRVPTAMTSAMGDDDIPGLVMQIQEVDQQARRVALLLPDAYNTLVLDAAEKTRMRGTVFDHILKSTSRRCPTARAVLRVQVLNRNLKDDQARLGRELMALLLARRSAVARIRGQYRALARMRLWLLVHVPLSMALLFALAGHVVSVFIYW
ncbi:MAG: hypothetical protein KA164_02195 [Rhodoferax sp.]|jgi:hypothetical protein|nr:hypothetical protein [Rhodoferax sp.]